ncbi:hypothetical protein [Bacillus sp. FJAT-29814]|uniref:hypothetical protein n=1 Tax=Bacillus sp. FJAT-29814 TaxID=1729688 RepID=UPI000836C04D|nr:hypothetical protein [Bacillus sp. FJAT-29814]
MQALNHAIQPKDYIKEKYPTIQNEWDSWGIYFFLFFKFCFLVNLKEAIELPSFRNISPIKKINFLKRRSEKRNIVMMRFITTLAHFVTVEPNKYLPEILCAFHKTKVKSVDSYNADYHHLKMINEANLMESTDININKNTLFKGNKQHKKYITHSEALHMLKTEWGTFQNLCQFGLIKLHDSDLGKKKVYLIERKCS